ncbi:unnamed protein product [Protopolystoma xenopodis]|uniref:Uncharacterized protein n=1 Tax=Protopolystoma xenopodis TaxID=117903 RepID=A0A3S5AQW4_9PLAT|nr:unnamed protein product [Protopolystoma xenopodis]
MSTPQTPNNHIFLLEDVNSSRTRSLFVSPDGLTKKSCSLITSTNGGADKVPRSLTSDIPLSNGQIVGGRLQETLAEAVGQLTAVARALATGSREKIEKEVCTASGEYRESKSIPIKLESKAKKSLLTVRHLFSIPLDSSGRLGFGRSPPKVMELTFFILDRLNLFCLQSVLNSILFPEFDRTFDSR